MNKIRVMILGANGFVGKNLEKILQKDETISLYCTSRQPNPNQLYLDICESSSWNMIYKIAPDIIIDTSGYGVIKNQSDLNAMYQINYLAKRDLIDAIFKELPRLHWIQIGTAFEYSLDQEALTEESDCFPKTHYGISKLLFSNYLFKVIQHRFTILRPFGMFGSGEDSSKFFPTLIHAQKNKKIIDLSDGQQIRDYFYVIDLANFILDIIKKNKLSKLDSIVINVGSGKPKSMLELSNILATQINDFDPFLWNWGAIPQRQGENHIFYNASIQASQFGFLNTRLEEAFRNTVDYYYNS